MRRGTVTFAGETVQLTPTEFRLLVPLVSHPNEVLTRQALSHVVWGYDDPDAGHMIDVHVGRMRNKLRMIRGDVPLETVRGRGFTWRDAQPDEYASQEF